VTFTANVTPNSGATTPTRKVAFTDGATTLCSGVALNSTGVATCTPSSDLSLGGHTITATYTPDTSPVSVPLTWGPLGELSCSQLRCALQDGDRIRRVRCVDSRGD
jgi:hypothetical protein